MKYLLVAGARPNFMKIAPIHRAFSSRRNGNSKRRSAPGPHPEEINPLCTDAISDLLFTTDTLADENLLNEGVAAEKHPLRR